MTRLPEENGRKQIGEGLAGAGAGFYDEVPAVGEGVCDSDGHFDLAGAMFVVGVGPRKRAVTAEKLFGVSLALAPRGRSVWLAMLT